MPPLRVNPTLPTAESPTTAGEPPRRVPFQMQVDRFVAVQVGHEQAWAQEGVAQTLALLSSAPGGKRAAQGFVAHVMRQRDAVLFLRDFGATYPNMDGLDHAAKMRIIQSFVAAGSPHALSNFFGPYPMRDAIESLPHVWARREELLMGLLTICGPHQAEWGVRCLEGICRMLPEQTQLEEVLHHLSYIKKLAQEVQQAFTPKQCQSGYAEIRAALEGFAVTPVPLEAALATLHQTYTQWEIRGHDVLHWLALCLKIGRGKNGELLLEKFRAVTTLLTNRNINQVTHWFLNRPDFWKKISPENFITLFDILLVTLKSSPRQINAVLGGIIIGWEAGLVPLDLNSPLSSNPHLTVADGIGRLIDRVHGFVPEIFAAYNEHGASVLDELTKHLPRAFTDDFSLADAEDLRARFGDGFLLGLHYMVSPPSGESTSDNASELGKIREMNKHDLRHLVPAEWRRHREIFTLTDGEWRVRDDVVADADDRLARLSHRFAAGLENPVSIDAVKELLVTYFSPNAPAGTLSLFYETLYAHVGAETRFKPYVLQPEQIDYAALLKLEEFFADADLLPQWLTKLCLELPDDVLRRHEKENVVGALTSETRSKIAARLALRLLKKPLLLIRNELENYAFAVSQTYDYSLFAVRGPLFCRWGKTPGLCSADDISLWTDPKFQLLAFAAGDVHDAATFARMDVKAEGYVQILEEEVDGNLHFIVLAIDPTVDFLRRHEAKQVYRRLLTKTLIFAARQGHGRVYLTTNTYVFSNRGDINRAAEQHAREDKLNVVRFGPVRWRNRGSVQAAGQNELVGEFYEVLTKTPS